MRSQRSSFKGRLLGIQFLVNSTYRLRLRFGKDELFNEERNDDENKKRLLSMDIDGIFERAETVEQNKKTPSDRQNAATKKSSNLLNPIRTLGDFSKPSHKGYRNTIELPVGNNVVPLRSDTIRLVQNGCSFHRLWSEDPNQHLKDFLKLVDSLDLDSNNRERTHLPLFQFSLRDQASNWLERLPAGSITTWEDLTTRFLAQFFPLGRTAKVRKDILMFQQHHEESLS
ncbi:zinc finger, CCHC-type containing protein [Tanacetum coccineum]